LKCSGLQALLHDAQGDEPAALRALSRAVHLAQPGGFIRLFVDLGPGLARLLNRLDLDAEALRYVGQILAAIQGDEQTAADTALDHPLTKPWGSRLSALAEVPARHCGRSSLIRSAVSG
jgi:LuxR family maltose regulon positive regulatory protein